MAFPDQLWHHAAGSDGGCWRPLVPSGKLGAGGWGWLVTTARTTVSRKGLPGHMQETEAQLRDLEE